MTFLETVEKARAFLERNGRVSFRALARQFELDDDALEELVEELVDVQQVAAREGKVLSWMGGASETPAVAPLTTAAAAAPDAERRQLTVLFCDLVGSTEISARLDPEDWREVVGGYQRVAGEVIARYGGHVAQYLGDGLLVYFGWPQAYDDAAERAVRAGLALVGAAATVQVDGTALAVRVGLHTGPVVVSALGGEGRHETLALGEVPNVAARVVGAAEPGTVVVSAATQRLVAGLFVVEERGAQQLKGVPEPLVLYRVVQPSGVRSRLDLSMRRTPLVGRLTELGVLGDAWERVVEGTGQTVLVQGEAGLGKSRLCRELRERLAGEPHTWLECRCSPYTADSPFRPAIELMEQALTFEPTDPLAAKLEKLGAGLARGGFEADEDAVPLLAEWLGLPESAGYTLLPASPDVKRRKVLETLAAWSLKLGELQPMVVLVEDLHWCDPSSLELLGRLVAQSATARVLLVGTARPEFTSPWPARSNLQTVTLGRLSRRQAREMIAAVSGARALPESVVAQLVERADGVPLYAEELTHAVVEAGGETAAAPIPVTLQDSLLARLDRLSGAKEVAQRAAVLGREFSYELLAATAGLDEGVLRQGLARLVEAELLFERGVAPAATYTFKHALVQEAGYESLLKRTRQQLHGRVADVLATAFPERAAAQPDVLAWHAEKAGRIDDAITGYQRAGEHAQARSAHAEATRHLRHAIALLATEPAGEGRDAREAVLQLTLTGSLIPALGYAHVECEAAFERARVLCEAIGDTRRLGWALGGLSAVYFDRGEVERARELAVRVVTGAEASGHWELGRLGHAGIALAEFDQGRFTSSLVHAEAVRSLYDPERDEATLVSPFAGAFESVMHGFPARILAMLGWQDRALARAREGVELARQRDHPYSLAQALSYEALVHESRGDLGAFREVAAEMMTVAEARGFPLLLSMGRVFLAGARVAGGEPEAIDELLAGLAAAAQGRTRASDAPFYVAFLAEAFRNAGRIEEARRIAEMGLARAAQTGQRLADARLLRLQGELVLASGGAPAAAEALFQGALDVARAQEAKSYELRAAMSLARLWREQGKSAEARALLAPLYAWFTEGFDTRDLVEAKSLLEELASA